MTVPNVVLGPGHRYTLDGKPCDGVTSVLGEVIRKRGLEKWIGELGNKEAERQRDEAGERGTLVHALATMLAEGTPDIPLGEDRGPVEAQLKAFTKWYEANVQECLGTETLVAHTRYHYAGCLDLLAVLRGDRVPTIVDIKSGKALYPEMRYQTAAYREAARSCEVSPKGCRRGILHVPFDHATGRAKPAEFHEHSRHAEDFQGFLSALYLYRDLQRGNE
jgi:hypothetical protein